jgi:hypothetical protein
MNQGKHFYHRSYMISVEWRNELHKKSVEVYFTIHRLTSCRPTPEATGITQAFPYFL